MRIYRIWKNYLIRLFSSDEMMQSIVFLREIRPEDLTDELSQQFFQANDQLWNVITRIQHRKQPKQVQKLKV
jgi:hypothetical protein